MFKQSSKKAFTLIEISVVIVIIAILVSGIVMGSGMIKNARINNARSLTSKSPILETDGLIAWYETSLINSFESGENFSNSQITKWLDISPSSENGNLRKNVLSTNASSAISYVENGIGDIPSIKFNGSETLTLPNFHQGNSLQKTIFLVIRPFSTNFQTILDSHSSGNTSSISIASTVVTLNSGSSVSTSTTTNSANFQISKDYILTIYFNEDSSKIYINDGENKTGGSNLSSTIGNNELSGLTIGANKSGSTNYNGLISEIIIFEGSLKSTKRKSIIKYLGHKYKISVEGV